MANTTIDGDGQTVTITGNDAVQVFIVNSGITLYLNRLTVANGAFFELERRRRYLQRRHAIVRNSTFSANSANYGYGGGISNRGTLTVSNSTFSDNSAAGGALRTAPKAAAASTTSGT